MPVSAPRRLLFVSATPASVRQGSGTYVGISVLRQALLKLGHEVTLIAPRRALGTWRRLWFNLHLRRLRTGATVVGFDLDGLFLGGAHSIASIKGVLAEESCHERGWSRLSLGLQARWEGMRARRADRVIATSRYAAAAIERCYRVPPERIRVVPELLDLAAWNALLAAAPLVVRTRPRVLCVAHLYPRKDVSTLLQAAARLHADVDIRIVGEGPELARLRRHARTLGVQERVRFLGHISRAELAGEYRNADLFCLPSRQEGFGIVLLEAMAAGLPIVAARATAVPEVVPEPACGCLFLPGDATELARLLELLLADATVRRDQGCAGRRRAAAFDAPAVAAQFLRAIS